MVKVVTLVLLMALAACQTGKGSFCAIAEPIRPSAAALASMTDAEVRKTLEHNETGARLCGWRP